MRITRGHSTKRTFSKLIADEEDCSDEEEMEEKFMEVVEETALGEASGLSVTEMQKLGIPGLEELGIGIGVACGGAQASGEDKHNTEGAQRSEADDDEDGKKGRKRIAFSLAPGAPEEKGSRKEEGSGGSRKVAKINFRMFDKRPRQGETARSNATGKRGRKARSEDNIFSTWDTTITQFTTAQDEDPMFTHGSQNPFVKLVQKYLREAKSRQ